MVTKCAENFQNFRVSECQYPNFGYYDTSLPSRLKKQRRLSYQTLFENKEEILKWLVDDGVIVLDGRIHDAVQPVKVLKLRPVVPAFMTKDKTQLGATETNRTRYITKV